MEFEKYVSRYRARLFRFAAVLAGDAHLADDVVSDAFAIAYQRWTSIGEMENPHAYVRKIVLNEYLSWRRRTWRTTARADMTDIVDAARDHADVHADRQQLQSELAALPPKQRAAIVLRYFEGLSTVEIAELLGTGVGAVRSNISRGLSQLRVHHDAESSVVSQRITDSETTR